MRIKYFFYYFLISSLLIPTSNTQEKRLLKFKIESFLPSHNYNKSFLPSFKIHINAIENLKGKLLIKLKRINENNFRDVYIKKTKVIKGENVFQISENEFQFSNLSTEFYEIYSQFLTSDTKYTSDTLTFVINIDSLRYPRFKPPDFDSFWSNTFSKLDSIEPNYKIDTLCDKWTEQISIYKVSFSGLDSMTIKAWYCIPKGVNKVPAVLVLPSYGNGPITIPYNFCEQGYAALALQIHGKDVESDTYPVGDDPSAGLNLNNPEKYYLKHAVAHIKRAIDFLYSIPEIDTNRIGVAGTSQGGGLALLITGLDRRIKATAATIPTLICYTQALESGAYWRIKRAIKNGLVDEKTALHTLSYFDASNLTEKFNQPVMLSAHYKDRISPPNTIISFYNQLQINNKQLLTQPELGHQFPEHHWDITTEWLKVIFKM
ncbi:MAG: Acetyl xylan esterase [Ignavibacteriae bacterium]|nr:MAG: Acetyl xylan esterase [Ignavibacteriota bacterium]